MPPKPCQQHRTTTDEATGPAAVEVERGPAPARAAAWALRDLGAAWHQAAAQQRQTGGPGQAAASGRTTVSRAV